MEGSNWKNCSDELGQRRYSDSEDRPVKPVLRTGELLFSVMIYSEFQFTAVYLVTFSGLIQLIDSNFTTRLTTNL